MRALRLLVAALLLTAPVALAQTEDEAGDVSEVEKDRVGPLRERVRPVSGHLFLKQGRVEVSPSATLSLNDAFFTKYLLGATVSYFPTEALGVNLRFGYSIPTVSGAAQICPIADDGTRSVCRPPTYAELDGNAPGQLTFLGGADVQYSPLYGKVALLAERFLHFDLYALGGLAAVGYKGPVLTSPESAQKLTMGVNLGVGTRLVINRWMTVRAELRDLVYREQVQPLPKMILRNQLMFELGFSMFLPSTFIPQ